MAKPQGHPTRTKGTTKATRKRERDARRFERAFLSEERVRFVRGSLCARCGVRRRNHNHHDPTKAAGGTYLDISPLCMDCHSHRHAIGVVTFWKQVGISYEESNAATERAWLAHSSDLP